MDEIIGLNVGGHVYTTSRATLTRFPDSMLGSMFSDRLPTAKDSRGNYVIDRDGPLFRFVLNFLRTSELVLPDDFQELDMLAKEADFYQIPGLTEAVTERQERRLRPQMGKKQMILEAELNTTTNTWAILTDKEVLAELAQSGLERHVPTMTDRFPSKLYLRKEVLFRHVSLIGFQLHTASKGLHQYQGDGSVNAIPFQYWVFTRDDPQGDENGTKPLIGL